MKVNSATPLAAGTQVMFCQQGTINDANGVSHPVWWLLDNGVIGTDGLAHTASQSYTGITTGGNILVTGTAVPRIGISNDPSGPALPPAVRVTGLVLRPSLGAACSAWEIGAPVGLC